MNHLVLVTTSFPDAAFRPGQEAAGTFVYDFASELAQRVPVTVVAPGGQEGVAVQEKLTVRRFAVPSLPLSLLKPSNPLHWPNIVKTVRAGHGALHRLAATVEIDHIFALWALPSGYWARSVGKKYRIPYSIWALGSDIWGLGKVPVVRNMLRGVLQESAVRFADGYLLGEAVTAISGKACRFLPSARKLPVKSARPLAGEPPYRLAFLGRWHPHKGVDLLLESLHLLGDDDWRKIEAVRICGGGPLEALVRERGEELQKRGYPVTIEGYLNREEAADLLLWSHYLLLPSRIESIPVIFSDAMQAHCPIITTPVGDLPRLVREFNVGVLAAEVDAALFCVAIQKALHKPPRFYGDGLHKAREQFDIIRSARQLVATLESEREISANE